MSEGIGQANQPLVAVEGVTVVFPGVVALDNVDFSIGAGEVHALTGENGSGKSTLARVINGTVTPAAGTIYVDGEPTVIANPRQGLDLGIVNISQELTLAQTLSVGENIFLGRLPTNGGRINWAKLRRDSREVLERIGVEVSESAIVGGLNVELQQMVEICRAFSSDARLLILDEATSSLSEAATRRLLQLVAEQRAQGVAVLMISHRMPELYAAASIATVLRDGKLVGTAPLPETTEKKLVSMMVGRELEDYYNKRQVAQGDCVLEVDDLTSVDGVLRPTSLRVNRGEIVGVAGLVGSGKAELGLALGGAVACDGRVVVAGREVSLGDPRKAIAGGVGFVPDDRKRSALLPNRSVGENFSLAWVKRLSRRGLLNLRDERKKVSEAIRRYRVITASAASVITTLSGGNQQKVVLGRTFERDVDVLVLSEPTRGVDVGAKSEIYDLLQTAAEGGAGIVLISSELPELLGIADRIVVFYGGEIKAEFKGRDMQEEAIAHVAVTGSSDAPEQTPQKGT
ncbi:MAG: sugar ABC transporter ATP-binding protein [Actinobacteria bacterium]|nr:sugar ABC transporter ATP-binding protein [Actinomycetota bacterium]